MAISSFQIKKYWYHQNNYVERYIRRVSLTCVSQNRQKDKMCTLIVTIRTVLWYVMSLAGTLLILVACFTDRWLHRPSLQERLTDMEGTVLDSWNSIAFLDDKIMNYWYIWKWFIIDFVETGKNVITSASDGVIFDVAKENIGLFEKCTVRTSEW